MHLLKRRRPEAAVTAASAPAPAPRVVADAGADVLRFLTEQGLAPTPNNYELGYLSRFDRDSTAARAVDAILMAGGIVSQGDADRIMLAYALHRAKQLHQEGEDEQRDEVRYQTLQLADLAANAVAATGQFGREIGDSLVGLEDAGARSIVSAMMEVSRNAEQQLLSASLRIEQLRQDVEAARSDAVRDALTGLLNRRGAEAEMDLLRQSGGRVAIALCDVDHFKGINDRFGHPVGDRVLKAVASELAEQGSPFLVARWGGEEFAIIMDGVDAERGRQVVDRAREAVSQRSFRLRETDEALGTVTFSAGVAACADGNFDAAIKSADEALYAAKAAGRNCIVCR